MKIKHINNVTLKTNNIIHSSNLCTEILEPNFSGEEVIFDSNDFKNTTEMMEYIKNKRINITKVENDEFHGLSDGETAVCNLGSISIGKYIKDGQLDKHKLAKNVSLAVRFLDKVIEKNYYPIQEAKQSNYRWRPIGLGLMGLQDYLFQLKIPFETEEAINHSALIQEEIYYYALKTSMELSKKYGPHKDFEFTHAANGLLQFDLSGMEQSKLHNKKRWDDLKEEIKKHGLRNSQLIAIAPTSTIASITNSYECIEPINTNMFKSENLSGEFIRINKYLVNDLQEHSLWNSDMIQQLKANNGSIQNISNIPDNIKKLYKTVWEIKQKWIMDHAIARGHFIDQSQSLNLFMESPTIDKLSSMYMYAFKNGLKTTYYLRSKSASQVLKQNNVQEIVKSNLENPDICESCT